VSNRRELRINDQEKGESQWISFASMMSTPKPGSACSAGCGRSARSSILGRFRSATGASAARLPTFPDLETVHRAQATQTRATLADTKDWDRAVTTQIVRGGKVFTLTATKADIAMQLLLHEVHHRAQAMAMLRQLGVAAQDLDYIGFVQKREEHARPSA